MSGGDDVVVNPESVEQTAQGVSTALGQAAEPGPVPHAAGASPIDAAASAASGEVIGLVSAASGDLAPRGGEVVGLRRMRWRACRLLKDRTRRIFKWLGIRRTHRCLCGRVLRTAPQARLRAARPAL